MPVADIVESRHVVVNAPPEDTDKAIRRIDFAANPSPIVRALIAMGVRAVNRVRRRRGKAPLQVKLTLENMEQFGRVILADEPGREIVVGALGRPGDMESTLERRTPEEFDAFDCPGFIKVVASLRMEPHGTKQTLLSHEVRTRASDTETRRKLFAMDRLMAPLQRFVTQRVLEHIKNTAERACAERKDRAPQQG